MMKNLSLKTFRTSAALLLSTVLIACNSEDAPLPIDLATMQEIEELAIAAATPEPCAQDFVFQRQLNGVADDTFSSSSEVQGMLVTKEEHWYAATSTIIFFTYAEDDTWCNVWNENGVTWDN